MKRNRWINRSDVKTLALVVAVIAVLVAWAKYDHYLDEQHPELREEYREDPRR